VWPIIEGGWGPEVVQAATHTLAVTSSRVQIGHVNRGPLLGQLQVTCFLMGLAKTKASIAFACWVATGMFCIQFSLLMIHFE